MNSHIANHINILGKFCGIRDINELSREKLFECYGIHQADVMVLFGGSILAGGDLLAEAINNHIAKKYIIVGGVGHTTERLRQIIHQEYPEIKTADLPEAEIFQRYLRTVYGCKADYLETQSTNCGNNITYLLDLLREKNIRFKNMILSQDSSMQKRMDAVLRKYITEDVTMINYATYSVNVLCAGDELCYEKEIHGMWTIDRYIHLLMGEIPRLTDDVNGYGPNGKNFIAHVDIPEIVKSSFEELKFVYGYKTREANPLYSSKES